MLSTIVIGGIFFGIIVIGTIKSIKSMRNNSCPGCSGGCSQQAKEKCGKP